MNWSRNPLRRLTPRSLWGRVLVLYGITILCFLALGLGTYYRLQFLREIEEVQDTAGMLVEVASQTVEESVLIGDYDTVQRTLSKILHNAPFASASFIDRGGHVLRVERNARPDGTPPAFVRELVAGRLYDVNRPISVGGRDYGVLRLTFNDDAIAQRLWLMIRDAAWLAVVCLVLSVAVLQRLLGRWLGQLSGLQRYEADVSAGRVDAAVPRAEGAPLEIEQAIRAVNRIASSMRSQFDQRIDTLIDSLVQHKSALDQACNVCELDPAGRLIDANERYVSASGYSRDELLTMSLAQLGEVQAPAGAVHDSVAALTGEVRLLDRGGRQRWRRRTVVPIFDARRQIEKFICIEIDITDRKRSEQLALAHARMHEQAAAFARDAQGAGSDAALGALLVRAAAAGLRADGAMLLRQGADGGATCLAAYRPAAPELEGPACAAALLSSTQPALKVDLAWGEQRARLSAHAGDGQDWDEDDRHFLDGLAAACAHAVERQRSGKRLHYLATHDPLTALPNRAAFGERLGTSIAAARSRSQRVPLFVIDLDHFKNVNDTLGHAAGDVLLLEAASRLRAALPAGCFVARLGGDEFSVIGSPGLAPGAIDDCARAVVETLRAPFSIEGQEVFIAASVGIAIYPRDGAGGDELVRNADTAMYSAKQQGRNRACRFEPAMNARLARRAMLEAGLRNALDKQEFSLVYQPKQDLGNGRLTGFEALLRWSSQGEPVPPAEFIPVLEECGLIVAVGGWVIETVCAQLRVWRELGMPTVPVAINLSARQFQQENLVETILAATGAARIAPSLLEFELTETMLMSDPDAAEATMQRLKAAGIGLSIDDFGTGYSSLAYLKRFPLDALKIDRAFVRDLPGDADDLAITCAVIALAHSLGLRVIAEGVEHAAQLDALRLHGCDEIQGYYYGRPMPPADCAARFIKTPPLLAEAGTA